MTTVETTAEVLSPFLSGTHVMYAWDSTSLGMLKTCPRLYQYTIIDGWQPKDDSVHLRFGIEYHKAIEEYDHARFDGKTHEDALRIVVGDLLVRIHDWNVDTSTRAGNYKNPRTLIQLVIDYLDKFSDDPAKTVTRETGEPAVEVSFRFELDWGPQSQAVAFGDLANSPAADFLHAQLQPQPYVLSGHLDRLVTFNDALYVIDHKTTTTTPSQYFFDQFNPNNQMTLYTLAGQIVLGAPLKGVIVEAAQILLEKPNRFDRGFTFRTQAQLDEWLHDLRFWLHSAENYATMGHWPMNDTACDKFGGCRFRGICSKDPSVRERYLEAQFTKLPPEDRWNPLKPR